MIRYGHTKIETPKEVTLVLHRKELLHDIEQYAYVEADTMPTDDEHAKHQLFDINQDGNSELIARTLNIAYNECVEMLYPYTKQEVWDDIMIDNAHCAPSAYNINMSVPDAFSGTTIALLQSLIHRYMVARVMYEWCGIVKPTSMEYWVSLATQAKEQARSALMARRKRLRRKQSLF